MLTLLRLAAPRSAGRTGTGLLAPLPPTATVCRLATGRSALLHLTTRLPRLRARRVLLPCYVAEGVIQPFKVAGFEIVFYRLQADLTPELADVARLLGDSGEPAVVVLIHYFGWSPRSRQLDALLDRREYLVVVDDLAHAPFSTHHFDIALYSLNKFLPVVDGAILVSNRTDIDVRVDESALEELPQDAQQAYREHLVAARDMFESHSPSQARVYLDRLGSSYETYYRTINSDLRPHRQSDASRREECSFPYDRLVERRNTNTRIVYDGLRAGLFELVHPVVPSGVVPFCVPARVPAGRRKQILDTLFERGVLLSTLQDKWDFIGATRRAEFAVESAFIDEHVLIPVSEFISSSAMQTMVATLNEL
jgi:hypothetical protein